MKKLFILMQNKLDSVKNDWKYANDSISEEDKQSQKTDFIGGMLVLVLATAIGLAIRFLREGLI